MKDMFGTKLKEGDVLLEIGRGGGGNFGSDDRYYIMKLWEMMTPFDGHAFVYDIDGSKSKFAWASLNKSCKINFDDFPPEFKYSFYHGMSHLESSIDSGTILQLIEKSDWKNRAISVEQVDQFHKLSAIKINSIQDIKDNIDILSKNGHVPHELVNDVFKVAMVNKTSPDFGNFKGEIGLASMYDSLNYGAIIEYIKQL